MSSLRVRDFMTRHPRSIPATSSTLETYELMTMHNFRHLPVTEGERVVGIVSDRDLLKYMPPPSVAKPDIATHGHFMRRPVSEIMTQNPLTVREDELLEVAVELLLVNQVSALLALDSFERLCGILTMVDVAAGPTAAAARRDQARLTADRGGALGSQAHGSVPSGELTALEPSAPVGFVRSPAGVASA